MVAERVFISAYVAARGEKPTSPDAGREEAWEFTYEPVDGVVRPKSPGAAALYDKFTSEPIRVEGGRIPRGKKEPNFEVGAVTMVIGKGGLHSVNSPAIYYASATSRYELIGLDVASFYPSLIARKGITPAGYGGAGVSIFSELLDERLRLKRAAKEEKDPAERAKMELQVSGQKLILNSFFGKMGYPKSTLFDPKAMVTVTRSGQFMLIDLIERLTDADAEVLWANTDGLYMRVERCNEDVPGVIADWQRDTGMTLEVERLARLAILSVNSYATLDLDGKVKVTGEFHSELAACTSPTTYHDPSALVVGKAITDALLRDVAPERTIRRCKDPLLFCMLSRKTPAVREAVLLDTATGTEAELPKLSRWYLARDGKKRILHRLESGGKTTPPQAIGVELLMDTGDGKLPPDLDKSRYIKLARKVIQKVGGYDRFDVSLLEGHPLAMEVRAAGLFPVPKWDTKSQMAGSDPARPTYLWDWTGIRTIGSYTGPEVGILVIDIDVFEKWAKAVSKGNLPLMADRWESLAGCMVSHHGDVKPDDVRRGAARGKLIFRFKAAPDHPLAKMSIGRWAKKYGIDAFYGKGMPSIRGFYADGDEYRLDGNLDQVRPWIIEMLIPPPPRPRKGKASLNGDGVHTLDDLRARIAGLAPVLGVEMWLEKPMDDRSILVASCPFDHGSGRNGDLDLCAGYLEDGTPWVKCKHASCSAIPAINARLQGRVVVEEVPVGAIAEIFAEQDSEDSEESGAE